MARSFNAETLIIEHIEPIGIITEENEDILAQHPDYCNPDLLRLSFWKKLIKDFDPPTLDSADMVGYAILKHDVIPSMPYDFWHIFEAVFAKYPHEHNCVPRPGIYHLAVAGNPLKN